MSRGLPRLGEPDFNGRVWGGSGVGAERRSELQFAECLEDSGPGGQILRNVSRIAAPGGARFRQPMNAGGSAKEKPSRVWGGSGVGAELRSELRSEPQSERS